MKKSFLMKRLYYLFLDNLRHILIVLGIIGMGLFGTFIINFEAGVKTNALPGLKENSLAAEQTYATIIADTGMSTGEKIKKVTENLEKNPQNIDDHNLKALVDKISASEEGAQFILQNKEEIMSELRVQYSKEELQRKYNEYKKQRETVLKK